MPLDDKFLLNHCHKIINDLTFLSEESKNCLGKAINSAGTKAPFGDSKQIQKLWRELLIDSIHTLKLRDKRERANQFLAKGMLNLQDNIELQQLARLENVYGISTLTEYFEAFAKYERVLYGSQSSYRDHIVHMLRVWLLGVYILTRSGSVESLDVNWQ